MRKSLWIIAFLLAATVGAPTVLRADITYTVDQTVGIGSVTGFIETDGTTGTLTTSNLLDWNLVVSNGSGSVDLYGPLSGNNSYAVLNTTQNDLTATSKEILFNFSATDSGYFFFETAPGTDYWCSETDISCSGVSQGESLLIFATGDTTSSFYTPLTGDQAIAVTPEPSTAILWFTGIVLMIVTRKRLAHILRLDTGTHRSLSPH